MKIAIDARIINSSTGRYIERLLTYLENIDTQNEYVVLVPEKDKDYWKPTSPNFRVEVADYKNYSFAEQVGFCKLLYSLNVDLVHFCMPQQPIFYTKPHVTTVHDLTLLKSYASDKNWFMYHAKQLVGRVVFYVIAHTSKKIITDTNFTKKEYLEYSKIDEDKIRTIYLSADILSENPVKPEQVDENDEFIMYVGQQSDYKNIKRLIESHQMLLDNHPDLKLVLVGSLNDAAKQNKAWSEDLGHRNVIFTGFVSDDELAWLYKNTLCYVFPSLMEGFGLPGLEAMLHGAPVASSNATCLPEVYGDAAQYFDPMNVDDMTSTIDTIISDTSVRDELVKKGKKQASEYSWLLMAKQTHEVYLAAINRK